MNVVDGRRRCGTRLTLLIVASLVLAAFQGAAQTGPEAEAIAAARESVARDIDSQLEEIPFDAWLGSLVGEETALDWEVNDCGEQTGDPGLDRDRDFPMCVEVTASGRDVSILLVVGTWRGGVSPEPPRFWSAAIGQDDGTVRWLTRLAELPAAVRRDP